MGTTGCASFAWMISFTWLNRALEFSVNSGTMTPVLSGAEASDAAGGVVAPAANGPYAIDDGASESENGTSEEEPGAGVEEVEVTEDERLEKENATPEPTIIAISTAATTDVSTLWCGSLILNALSFRVEETREEGCRECQDGFQLHGSWL